MYYILVSHILYTMASTAVNYLPEANHNYDCKHLGKKHICVNNIPPGGAGCTSHEEPPNFLYWFGFAEQSQFSRELMEFTEKRNLLNGLYFD